MDAELAQFRLYLQRQNLSQRTIKQLQIFLKVLLQACTPFTPHTFELFLASQAQKYSAASLNKYVQTAKKYVEFKQIEFDPRLLKKFKESPEEKGTFSDEEIMSFLTLEEGEKRSVRGAYVKMTAFFYILAFTGARPNEVAKLQRKHVDQSNNSIILGYSKTGKGRVIAISPILQPVLNEYLKTCNTEFLFTTYLQDSPIRDYTWIKHFNERKKRLGILKNLTSYSFRHSLATKLLDNDAALFAVQDILGHTDPKTTRMYYHGNLNAQRKALQKDPLVIKVLGAKSLIKQIHEYIDAQKLDECSEIDYKKILEAKTLLFEAIKT